MQWADALHQWLGITEDRVHVVTGKHNAYIAGLRFDFLIVSYNMVCPPTQGQGVALCCHERAVDRAGVWQEASSSSGSAVMHDIKRLTACRDVPVPAERTRCRPHQ